MTEVSEKGHKMNQQIILGVAVLFTQAVWAADVPAVLQWSHRVELSTPASGIVQSVNVEAGDLVKKGQVLLTLDSSLYQAKVSENQAALVRHNEEAAEAKRDLDRVQELYNRTVISTTELDQAKLRNTKAQSMATEAKARLKQHQKGVEDAAIRAPFDAVVVARQAESGQTVAAGLQPQTLLVLAKSGEMLARMRVQEGQVDKLKIGQSVTIAVGGQNYAGKIKSIALEPVKLKEESAYPVDVVFAPQVQLRAGLAAVVKMP